MKNIIFLMVLVSGLTQCSVEQKKQKDPLGIHEKETYELKTKK